MQLCHRGASGAGKARTGGTCRAGGAGSACGAQAGVISAAASTRAPAGKTGMPEQAHSKPGLCPAVRKGLANAAVKAHGRLRAARCA
jgi:hypothetical protein